jgi:hypothetical protein
MIVQSLDFDSDASYAVISFLFSISFKPLFALMLGFRATSPVVTFLSSKRFELPARIFDFVIDRFIEVVELATVVFQSLGI